MCTATKLPHDGYPGKQNSISGYLFCTADSAAVTAAPGPHSTVGSTDRPVDWRWTGSGLAVEWGKYSDGGYRKPSKTITNPPGRSHPGAGGRIAGSWGVT